MYFNIYSATDDLTLKALARQYLDLIIADKAQAHLPNAAVTAGAQATIRTHSFMQNPLSAELQRENLILRAELRHQKQLMSTL